MDAEIAKCAQR